MARQTSRSSNKLTFLSKIDSIIRLHLFINAVKTAFV
jgi:hypothetical protein